MPLQRCRNCGFGPDAHHLRTYYEKPGAEPQHGHSSTLANCPGFVAINAELDAQLEAKRRNAHAQ